MKGHESESNFCTEHGNSNCQKCATGTVSQEQELSVEDYPTVTAEEFEKIYDRKEGTSSHSYDFRGYVDFYPGTENASREFVDTMGIDEIGSTSTEASGINMDIIGRTDFSVPRNAKTPDGIEIYQMKLTVSRDRAQEDNLSHSGLANDLEVLDPSKVHHADSNPGDQEIQVHLNLDFENIKDPNNRDKMLGLLSAVNDYIKEGGSLAGIGSRIESAVKKFDQGVSVDDEHLLDMPLEETEEEA